jgi:hypothetical protein
MTPEKLFSVHPNQAYVKVPDISAMHAGEEVEILLFLENSTDAEPNTEIYFTLRHDCYPALIGKLSDNRTAVLNYQPDNTYFLRVGESPMLRVLEAAASRHNEEYPIPCSWLEWDIQGSTQAVG